MNLNHIAKKPWFDLFYRNPCMPQVLRLAMYDATRVRLDGTPVGARGLVYLENQRAVHKSAELKLVFDTFLEMCMQGNHIQRTLSVPDILQLGGYAAVEYCGGPQMIFQMGREQIEQEKEAVTHEPETYYGSCVTNGLARQGLPPEEFVALMGIFTLGFHSDSRKGKGSRWCKNPYVFDNSYYKEVLLGENSMYYKSEADYKMIQNPELREWCVAYAEDQDLFFKNYAKAHVKISEQTHTTLMSEFDAPGSTGYQELSYWKVWGSVLRELANGNPEAEQWAKENIHDGIRNNSVYFEEDKVEESKAITTRRN